MNGFVVVGIAFLLQGCMPNQSLSTAGAAEVNVANLARIHKGMTQQRVLQIMRQPYSDATFRMDQDIYDVWFYVTEPTVLGQSRMVPLNLTPLTFKNGILIGWGYSYYNYLKKRELEYSTDTSETQVTMSRKPKSEDGPKDAPKKENKALLDEEDEEMLQEERDQDFNQTLQSLLQNLSLVDFGVLLSFFSTI